jgi:multidrug resistance efflux pump
MGNDCCFAVEEASSDRQEQIRHARQLQAQLEELQRSIDKYRMTTTTGPFDPIRVSDSCPDLTRIRKNRRQRNAISDELSSNSTQRNGNRRANSTHRVISNLDGPKRSLRIKTSNFALQDNVSDEMLIVKHWN